MGSVGELSKVCSQIVLKCLYLARIGGPDIPWSVNKHARAVTKWTRACDTRLARLISYVHHTSEFKQYCHVGHTAVDNYRTMFESRISAGRVEKLPFPQNLRISSWSYDMAGHAKKCVERYCELSNKTTQQLYKVSTPCIDDHHFKEEEMGSVGELSKVCSQIVLKCLYLARIGRPDILWSVNKLARSITKWTKACDTRLAHLISHIFHTIQFKQYCHVGNTAKQCRLVRFQESDFAGDLEHSKIVVPKRWMCKKQTSVSHSSREAEIISLDAGLRMDGIPALDIWDLVIDVLHSSYNQSQISKESVQGSLLHDTSSRRRTPRTKFRL